MDSPDGISPIGEINDDSATSIDPWSKRFSLSLDGGGVRGYSSLLILQRLMDEIGRLEMDHSDGQATCSHHPEPYRAPYDSKLSQGHENEERRKTNDTKAETRHRYLPCHYFDFIAGTSTGGLIAIMLARLRMSVDQALDVYKKMSKEVFSSPRVPVWFPGIYTYNHRKLETVVKRIVDRMIPPTDPEWVTKERIFFSELNGICSCIVVANGETVRKQSNTLYLFRSYISPPIPPSKTQSNQNRYLFIRNAGARDYHPIWKVARATSAAPGYLREITIEGRRFIDGALDCNNPSVELWREISFLYGPSANSLILSIGTGLQEPSNKFGGNFSILTHALAMATDSQKIHENMVELSGLSPQFDYYRLNVVEGMGTIKLGAYNKLGKMKGLVEDYLRESKVIDELREVAKKLVDSRRARIKCNKDRWEAFCCETRYRCDEGPGGRCQYGYHERTRHRFVEHLKRDHNISDRTQVENLVENAKKLHDKGKG